MVNLHAGAHTIFGLGPTLEVAVIAVILVILYTRLKAFGQRSLCTE